MEPKQFTYAISGKKYVQKPLVLGQVLLLAQLMRYMPTLHDFKPQTLLATLGLQLPDALAIVLIPEGTEASEKADDEKRRQLSQKISFDIDADTVTKVIEDFFDCNPVASLLEKLSGLTDKLVAQVKNMQTITKLASKPSSPSSAEETSQSETPSSGGSPSKSASLT